MTVVCVGVGYWMNSLLALKLWLDYLPTLPKVDFYSNAIIVICCGLGTQI